MIHEYIVTTLTMKQGFRESNTGFFADNEYLKTFYSKTGE